MKAMHEEWTDKLSEYLDGELPDDERYAVESHLSGCAECTAVLEDLKRIVAHARSLDPRPPRADLWAGIAERIESPTSSVSSVVPSSRARGATRRVSFTLPQLAAAAMVLIAVSAGVAWRFAERSAGSESSGPAEVSRSAEASSSSVAVGGEREASADRAPSDVQSAAISLADDQYDAAVADLERALRQGRGRLDANTIAIVEHNLQIIDQAIAQARQALASDPANSYLSSHLVEARRRKLDLLRRAAELTSESD
jgi:negative regulator of sigma E activity